MRGRDASGPLVLVVGLPVLLLLLVAPGLVTAQTPPCATDSTAVSWASTEETQRTGLVDDCNTLLGIKAATEYAGTGFDTLNWSADRRMDQWDGLLDPDSIAGTPPRVTALTLRGRGLSGSIPPTLGDLTGLRWLYLQDNQLTGFIPTDLGKLTNLQLLYLNGNRLEGQIPTDLKDLSNLTLLHLNGNRLEGQIPTDLKSLSNLQWLALSDNHLSGEIPEELAELSNLKLLHLEDNHLSGSIPAALGTLTNLQWLVLSHNHLSGEIPEELGKISNLHYLHLSTNALTGKVPSGWGGEEYALEKLKFLDLSFTNLTGGLPQALASRAGLDVQWFKAVTPPTDHAVKTHTIERETDSTHTVFTVSKPADTTFPARQLIYEITVFDSEGNAITGLLNTPVQVCLPHFYDLAHAQAYLYRYQPAEEAGQAGRWERQTAGRQTDRVQVCAQVQHFSYFRVGQYAPPPMTGDGGGSSNTGGGDGSNTSGGGSSNTGGGSNTSGGSNTGGGDGDQHGNSASRATPVAFRSQTPRQAAVAGQLHTRSDRDYFRLHVPQAGVLVVETTGRTDTQGTVWQADAVVATATGGGAGRNFRLHAPVEAGEAVIAVAGERGQTGRYSLRLRLVVSAVENPRPHSFQSGIGIISGWVCEADEVEIEFTRADGTVLTQPAAYGTARADTRTTPDGAVLCGDTDNGFGLLFNWNLLGAGEHDVIVTADAVEISRATVTVTTLGEEFVQDVVGECVVEDFPRVGETVRLVWQESSQNFVLAGAEAPAGENWAGEPGVGYLENPAPHSFQSGIGIISGWVCEADEIVIEFVRADGAVLTQPAAYGTARADTHTAPDRAVLCGDTDNGFGLLFNWNLLGAGTHDVSALVDGVELGRATVTVTVAGEGEEEEFLRGAVGECAVEDFPSLGERVTLEWQQHQQNFVITGVD